MSTDPLTAAKIADLCTLGVATVYEASGRRGLVDEELITVVPGARAAGPARTVQCGQSDNRAVHEAMDRLQPGEVLVLTMQRPVPVALVGELLITQAMKRGAAAVLVDAAVRDVEELRELGLPIWTRWIRSAGATKELRGRIDVPVRVGGADIFPGDPIVLDSDGVVVVPGDAIDEVLAASKARFDKEAAMRRRLDAGELSYDIHGLRAHDVKADQT